MDPTSSTALLLDLSLPVNPTSPTQTLSSPPKLLTPSGGLSCILQPSSAGNRPKLSLKFPSPMPESLGMRTAREWHREQLLQARLRMEQRNALRSKRGQIPTTLTTSLTCDHAREDVAPDTIAMDTPLHRDPDNPQRPYPFCQGHYPHTSLRELRSNRVDNLPRSLPTWQLFASRVKTPSRWSISCPRPSNKTTKIPTQYRLPTLPKGWRYEDDVEEVKQESLDSLATTLLDHLATTPPAESSAGSRRRSSSQRILRSTRGTRRFPSPSPTGSDARRQPDTSGSP